MLACFADSHFSHDNHPKELKPSIILWPEVGSKLMKPFPEFSPRWFQGNLRFQIDLQNQFIGCAKALKYIISVP